MEIKKEEIEKFQEILKSKSDKEVIEMYQNIKSYEKQIKDMIIEEFGNRNLKIEEKIEEGRGRLTNDGKPLPRSFFSPESVFKRVTQNNAANSERV